MPTFTFRSNDLFIFGELFDHKTAFVAPLQELKMLICKLIADTHFGPPTSDDDGDSLGPGVGCVLVQVHVLHAPHHLHPPHHVVAEALELAVLVPVPVEHSAALAVHLLLGEPQPEGGHLIYSASTSLYHQNIPIFVSLHLHFSKPLS